MLNPTHASATTPALCGIWLVLTEQNMASFCWDPISRIDSVAFWNVSKRSRNVVCHAAPWSLLPKPLCGLILCWPMSVSVSVSQCLPACELLSSATSSLAVTRDCFVVTRQPCHAVPCRQHEACSAISTYRRTSQFIAAEPYGSSRQFITPSARPLDDQRPVHLIGPFPGVSR